MNVNIYFIYMYVSIYYNIYTYLFYAIISFKFYFTRLSARVSFLDTEMKIQIRAPNKLTNKVTALLINIAARWRMKLAEMHVLFRMGFSFSFIYLLFNLIFFNIDLEKF